MTTTEAIESETEIRTSLGVVEEQTPPQRVDQAWEKLTTRISTHTIHEVLAAELEYARSLRDKTEPPTEMEISLIRTGNFRSKAEKEATIAFFDKRLEALVRTGSIAQKTGGLNAKIEQRIQIHGAVITFINQSMPPMAQRRWQ